MLVLHKLKSLRLLCARRRGAGECALEGVNPAKEVVRGLFPPRRSNYTWLCGLSWIDLMNWSHYTTIYQDWFLSQVGCARTRRKVHKVLILKTALWRCRRSAPFNCARPFPRLMAWWKKTWKPPSVSATLRALGSKQCFKAARLSVLFRPMWPSSLLCLAGWLCGGQGFKY